MAPHHYVPILSSAASVFATFRLLPSIVQSIVRPFDGRFGVTPKGRLATARPFDARTFGIAVSMSVLTVGGLILNTVPEWQPLDTWSFFPVAAAWSFLNLIVLALVMLICIEAPHQRREERFPVDEPGRLRIDDADAPCRIECLSLSGARLRLSAGGTPPLVEGSAVSVAIADVGDIPARVAAVEGEVLRVAFLPLGGTERENLITRLFTGDCHNTVETLGLCRLLLALGRRAFGRPIESRRQPRGRRLLPSGEEGQSASA